MTFEAISTYRYCVDPLPNGGCTTTCEALWMGAPVITAAGHSYVSRMSTAVLSGCGLSDWVAADERLICSWLLTTIAAFGSRDRWRQQYKPVHW